MVTIWRPGAAVAKQQVYDGTTWVNQSGDSSGRSKVVLDADNIGIATETTLSSIDGKIIKCDTDNTVATAKLQGYDGTDWQNLQVQDSTNKNLRVAIYDGSSLIESIDGNSDGKASTKIGLATGSYLYGFNGSSWDRIRYEQANDARDQYHKGVWTHAFLYGFDGSYWHRLRTQLSHNFGSRTSTGPAPYKDTYTGFDKYTWIIITDASSSNATVRLEGSIDTTYWFTVDEWTGTGKTMRHVVNKPVKALRPNIIDMGDASSITVKLYCIR